MLEVVFSVIMLFFAVVGLIEILKIISLSIFKVKNDKETFLVVPISGLNEGIEMILRDAISRAKWISGTGDKKVFCIDFNMDKETRKICEIICQEYDFICICSPSEFIELIKPKTN